MCIRNFELFKRRNPSSCWPTSVGIKFLYGSFRPTVIVNCHKIGPISVLNPFWQVILSAGRWCGLWNLEDLSRRMWRVNSIIWTETCRDARRGGSRQCWCKILYICPVSVLLHNIALQKSLQTLKLSLSYCHQDMPTVYVRSHLE